MKIPSQGRDRPSDRFQRLQPTPEPHRRARRKDVFAGLKLDETVRAEERREIARGMVKVGGHPEEPVRFRSPRDREKPGEGSGMLQLTLKDGVVDRFGSDATHHPKRRNDVAMKADEAGNRIAREGEDRDETFVIGMKEIARAFVHPVPHGFSRTLTDSVKEAGNAEFLQEFGEKIKLTLGNSAGQDDRIRRSEKALQLPADHFRLIRQVDPLDLAESSGLKSRGQRPVIGAPDLVRFGIVIDIDQLITRGDHDDPGDLRDLEFLQPDRGREADVLWAQALARGQDPGAAPDVVAARADILPAGRALWLFRPLRLRRRHRIYH